MHSCFSGPLSKWDVILQKIYIVHGDAEQELLWSTISKVAGRKFRGVLDLVRSVYYVLETKRNAFTSKHGVNITPEYEINKHHGGKMYFNGFRFFFFLKS